MNDQKYRSDDPLFFRRLFQCYGKALVVYVSGFVHASQLAEDVVQDVFVEFYRQKGRFESPTQARSFLYTAARNRALDLLKHQRVEQKYLDTLESQDSDEQAYEQFKNEIYARIAAAIDSLPEGRREIFRLYLDGLSNEQIAEQLHISIHTVKTQKKRVMKHLRTVSEDLAPLVLLFFS